MNNILLMTLNTLKVTFKKKSAIIVFIILPITGILFSMLTYSNSGSDAVKVAVLNRDQGVISKDIIKAMENEKKFKISIIDEKEADKIIASGKSDCVLKIPESFSESVYNNEVKPVEAVSIKGEAATAWLKGYMNMYLQNLNDIAKAAKGDKDLFNSMYSNYIQGKVALKVNMLEDQYRSKGMTAQSIGFLIMFMMLGAGFTAELIIKEKRNRTYFRICSAPVSPWEFIASNVLTSFIIVFIQAALVIFAITKIFGLKTFVPPAELLVILLCFGLVAIGLGLLIVSFSKDSVQAGTLQTLVITPTCLLSGCFWPGDMMSDSIKKISNFMPQKWVIEAIRKIQTGGSFNDVLIYIAVILAFAAVFFLTALYRFSRNNNVENFV